MIKLSRASVGQLEKDAVMEVLDQGYLGMGQSVQRFEQELTAHFGRPAVCIVNGTAAIHLACQAAGLGPGDEVLVQSLTYVASFQAIAATGATPVACDVVADTVTLDIADAERRITPRTKAVMPVHYASGVGDLDGIYAFAKRHGLRVIEDAAQAFGTTYHGKQVGSFGDIACFSFDGIKNITAGEGGCVVTEDEDVLAQIRDARLLGVERDTERRFAGERSWEFDVNRPGWRYHMSNVMAAIGVTQLSRLPEFAKKRKALARRYDALLADHRGIQPLARDAEAVVPHIYVIRISGADRDTVRKELLAREIETGIHWKPNHLLTRFAAPGAPPMPTTDVLFPQLLTLPLHAGMDESDVERVCKELKSLVG